MRLLKKEKNNSKPHSTSPNSKEKKIADLLREEEGKENLINRLNNRQQKAWNTCTFNVLYCTHSSTCLHFSLLKCTKKPVIRKLTQCYLDDMIIIIKPTAYLYLEREKKMPVLWTYFCSDPKCYVTWKVK